MGKNMSRRQLLAAGGVGVAGVGTFAYLDPLDLGLLGGSSSVGFADWLATDVVTGERRWNQVMGFDRDRYEAAKDVLPDETASALSGDEFLLGEVYEAAIDPETVLLEYQRVNGIAVSGSVDVDRLRSAGFPDRPVRMQYPEAEIDASIEQVGEHRGLRIYHKSVTLSGSARYHKAVAVDDGHYVQTPLRGDRDAVLETARGIVDAGLTGEGRYSETNENFQRFLALLDPGFVADLALQRPNQPVGGTLAIDGDAVIHREVWLRREALSPSCGDTYERVVREEYGGRPGIPDLQDLQITVDGRAVIAEAQLPAGSVSPSHSSPFLANQGAFIADGC